MGAGWDVRKLSINARGVPVPHPGTGGQRQLRVQAAASWVRGQLHRRWLCNYSTLEALDVVRSSVKRGNNNGSLRELSFHSA